MKLIATITGIGYYGALLIDSEIDDVHRFCDAQHLCSYAGLVPSVQQSSNVCYHRRTSKQGSRRLRWILIEAVPIHITNEPNSQLTKFFLRVARRKGNRWRPSPLLARC